MRPRRGQGEFATTDIKKKKQKGLALGLGEMDTKDHRECAQRWMFLWVFETMSNPIEIKALKADVFPAREREAEAEELGLAVRKWMERWNLDADWLYRVVIGALRHGTIILIPGSGRLVNAYSPVFSEPLTPEERAVGLRLTWSPQTETRARFLARAMSQLERRCDEIQPLAAKRGCRPTVRLRTRRGAPIAWSPQTETRARFLARAMSQLERRCDEIQALAAKRGCRSTVTAPNARAENPPLALPGIRALPVPRAHTGGDSARSQGGPVTSVAGSRRGGCVSRNPAASASEGRPS